MNALRSILSPRHPSQLYEAFFEGIVLFAILWFVRTRTRQPNGVLTGLFFIFYAIFRIVWKIFANPMHELIRPFTRGQFFSFFLVAIGAAFIVVAKRRPDVPEEESSHPSEVEESRCETFMVTSRIFPLRFSSAQDEIARFRCFRKTRY